MAAACVACLVPLVLLSRSLLSLFSCFSDAVGPLLLHLTSWPLFSVSKRLGGPRSIHGWVQSLATYKGCKQSSNRAWLDMVLVLRCIYRCMNIVYHAHVRFWRNWNDDPRPCMGEDIRIQTYIPAVRSSMWGSLRLTPVICSLWQLTWTYR